MEASRSMDELSDFSWADYEARWWHVLATWRLCSISLFTRWKLAIIVNPETIEQKRMTFTTVVCFILGKRSWAANKILGLMYTFIDDGGEL